MGERVVSHRGLCHGAAGAGISVTELSQQAITTILGVNVLKVLENVFEHNDGPVFGRSNGKQDGYENCTALTVWDGLIAVQGTDLLCEGKKVGTVSQGEKQFAVVNTRLVIWPDKLSLDLKTLALSAMEAQLECSGGTFETGSVKLSGCGDLTELFAAGDGMSLSG